jgi:ABC-2 type transport system permease protein
MIGQPGSPLPRRPAASGPVAARRNGGWLGLLAVHCLVELRRAARSIEYLIVVVALPMLLYAMFGLPDADVTNVLADGTHVGTMMMVSLCCYGVVSLAIFTFGEYVAKERAGGWARTMRSTPLPVWSNLAAKAVLGLVGAAAIVASTAGLAVVAGNVRLELAQWVGLVATLLAGVLAFSTLGFAIAYATRPRAATAISNLIFLPLSFLSGFFVPLSELPSVLARIAVWLPTYHFGQLAWRQVAPASDVAAWVGIAPARGGVHLTWVLATALACSAIALAAAGREGVTRRG